MTGKNDNSCSPQAPNPQRRSFLGNVARGSVGATLVLAFDAPLPAAEAAPAAPAARNVSLRVNGIAHELSVEPRVTLLDALREHLHLTGAKKGCDRGQCGACTVLVNGRRINSCLTLAVMHDGEEITTVEGLAGDRDLSPLQAAFVERDAFQCGYCTPGQLCAATALVDELRAGEPSAVTDLRAATKPEVTDEEIRERMSGNLCRCGAYPNIVAAIRDAATSDLSKHRS